MTESIPDDIATDKLLMTSETRQRVEILRFLAVTHEPGDVVELRSLETRTGRGSYRGTGSGYYTDLEALARDAIEASPRSKGVYVTMNRIAPELLSRRAHQFEIVGKDSTTGDHEVRRRRLILVDFDPVRVSGIPSTSGEHNAAREKAREVQEALESEGWPAPMAVSTGNGAACYFAVNLPPDDGGLVKRVLEGLAARFDSAAVKIDTSVHNPARIVRLPGTMNQKGSSTEERPHRPCGIIDIPDELKVVPEELLEKVSAPKAKTRPREERRAGPSFDLKAWIAKYVPEAKGPTTWNGEGEKWVFPVCPWNSAHANRSAYIVRRPSGAIVAGCHHDGCKGQDWHTLRDLKEPGWRGGGKRRGAPVAGDNARANLADEDAPEETTTARLIRLAEPADLFHTSDSDPYTTIPIGGHRETWPIRSRAVRDWLAREFYLEVQKPPSKDALSSVLDILAARARFDGQELDVHVRVAPRDAGGFYLDLADPAWRAVEITEAGWKLVSDSPVRFRRKSGMLAIPEPEHGGSVEEIRRFLDVGDDDAWRLVVAWLSHAMTTRGPYSVLALHGEQGTAKSTTARVLRRLVDPHKVELRSEPRDDRDLMIAAEGSWLICLDNLSAIGSERSDQLCRLSTGGGFGTRALYTDDEERLFDAMRPVILTGIEELASAGDLLDRSIVLTLPMLDENGRLEEEDFWRAFGAERPRLLGALLDVVSGALRAFPTSRPARLCRMADYHRWGAAVEQALGWPGGSFTLAYLKNRGDAVGISLEASPVPAVLVEWLAGRESWSGSASLLLDELGKQAGDRVKRKDWPTAAHVLSGALRRLAPALRQVGIHVTFSRDGRSRTVYLATTKAHNGASSASSPGPARDADDARDAVLQTLPAREPGEEVTP